MKQVNLENLKKLQFGISLKVRKGHTISLETTEEPLTVHTGLSLLYAMAEALEIRLILDEHVLVKERERGTRNRSISWLWRPMGLPVVILWMIWRP